MDRRTLLTALPAAGFLSVSGSGARAAHLSAETIRGRVDGADVSLYVRDWGSGSPILFLSAWGFPSDSWQYQMLPLHRQGFRCVAYDRRGHGRSTDPGGGYDYDTLADDLSHVLEALDLRDVTLVAYSMGSGEAVRYITRHGRGRIARILFLAPTTPFLLRTADNPQGVDAAALAAGRAGIAEDFPGGLSSGFDRFLDGGVSEELKGWAKTLMLQCSLKALTDCQEAMTSTDFRAELRNLRLPTLVIHGDSDRSAPPALTGLRTAALVPGAEFRSYAGAPHGLVFTHMARLAADIAAFATRSG